jgi:uncharacterized protein
VGRLPFNLLKENIMVGAGLRHQHFPYLLSESKPATKIKWFEIISENFINTRGLPFERMMKVRQDYPISMHGVSLSLGLEDELDLTYLNKVRDLVRIVEPILLSDHLCFTGLRKNNLHNLLPLPYTEETLKDLIPKINYLQDFFNREILLENLSAYFSYTNSSMTEWTFLRELSNRTGSKILLDINNVYVNSVNQGFDPYAYLDAIPDSAVGEIHLAGFSDMGNFLFDTHSTHVCDKVWDLFSHKIKTCASVPFMIEWDEEIPEFKILEDEAMKALDIWDRQHGKK